MEKDEEDKQVPGMGRAKRWHRQRGHPGNQEGTTGECFLCCCQPEVMLPSTRTLQHSALYVQDLMSTFKSGPHLKTASFFPLAPVPLPHTQVFSQCLPNKGGKLWFHFALVQHHSNFYLKTAEHVQCTLASEKSAGLPLTGTAMFLWVPWWETRTFFTFSYSWSLFPDTVDVCLQFWLTQPFLF